MSPEDMVGAAILAETEDERQLNIDRAVLNYAVSRAVTCTSTGAVLDQSSAFYAEFKHEGGMTSSLGPWSIPAHAANAGKSEDEAIEAFRGVMERVAGERGFEVKLYIGKELFGDTSRGGS